MNKKNKIEDEVFRVDMCRSIGCDTVLEFYVCKTNDTKPYRDIRELGIVVYEKTKKDNDFMQIDNLTEFGIEEIDSLIKYLQKVKKHVRKFNENSKPING